MGKPRKKSKQLKSIKIKCTLKDWTKPSTILNKHLKKGALPKQPEDLMEWVESVETATKEANDLFFANIKEKVQEHLDSNTEIGTITSIEVGTWGRHPFDFTIRHSRVETDEEFEKRIKAWETEQKKAQKAKAARAKAQRVQQEMKERALLEKLQKKYGKNSTKV